MGASLLPIYHGAVNARKWHSLVLTCILSLLISWHVWLLVTHPVTERVFQSATGSQKIHLSHTTTISHFPSTPTPTPTSSPPALETVNGKSNKNIVVSSLKGDDVDWIQEHLPDWQAHIYVANDANATLKPPANKGHESMIYLTYIIDNYDTLPDVSVFIHSLRYQWHNDDPMYDGVPILQRLNTSLVQDEGYVNLRCSWTIGCPFQLSLSHKQPISWDSDERTVAEHTLYDLFPEFYPEMDRPEMVGSGCCAQFAVSRDQIRKRSKESYMKYRDWLLMTTLSDAVSGRVFEYTWHIMMGKPAHHCPSARDCYCKTFGLCDLECSQQGECKDRYVFPPGMAMPEGWPNNRPEGWGVVKAELKDREG